MTTVSRYGKLVAHEGRGAELAKLLLDAADALAGEPGCLLYLVNRQAGAPDTVWVTEMWSSQEDLDASLAQVRGSGPAVEAMAFVGHAEMIELDALGGKGPGQGRPASAR
ncbi:putative quinol monooxygenase [Actinomadura darangshiensis]|nr:antibiotic biosynthesis monooxygenase [Actinomadura darangshiensis]